MFKGIAGKDSQNYTEFWLYQQNMDNDRETKIRYKVKMKCMDLWLFSFV